MNMWAAYPEFFPVLEQGFVDFLSKLDKEDTKKEYLLPIIVDGLLKADKATVKVMNTPDRWIGVTYKEDIELAQQGFKDMIAKGVYKEKLW